MRSGCVGRMEITAHCGWGTGGRLRAEPQGDLADGPTWESRRARVQKDIIPLAARDRELSILTTLHSYSWSWIPQRAR